MVGTQEFVTSRFNGGRIARFAGAAAIAIAGTVVPAEAKTWGPSTKSYKGSAVVTGWGEFYSDDKDAISYVLATDKKKDGNRVFGETEFSYKGDGVRDKSWHSRGGKRTKEAPDGIYSQVGENLKEGLVDEGERMRGKVRACAQMGFPVKDQCTRTHLVTIDY